MVQTADSIAGVMAMHTAIQPQATACVLLDSPATPAWRVGDYKYCVWATYSSVYLHRVCGGTLWTWMPRRVSFLALVICSH